MGKSRRAGMAFIMVTLFLDVLGIGIIVPVLPHLVTEMLGGDSSRAASYYGLLAGSYALMQFLFAPLLGALSDRIGRRPVLLVSLFGFGVNYVILGLAPTLAWLFVARVFSGITGASITTANAYIADISDATNRARNFGMVGAAFGLGFIFGPAIGGVLGHFGPRVPFFVSAGIVLVNWLYGLLVLPESLSRENRRPFSMLQANPLGGLLRLREYPMVAGLAMAFMFAALAQRGLESVWVLYTQFRYGWGELQNGLALALVGLMAAVVQGYLVRHVVRRVGERKTVVWGLLIASAGFILYGLATQGWMLMTMIAVGSLGGVAGPAIQALVTGSVLPTEQGAVQGMLTSLLSLTSIFAPLIATQLFAYFTGPSAPLHLPGAPFFVGSLFMILALATVLRAFRLNPVRSAN
jgi:DHA1 family tetracycline resistance protein-like MFS transporter